MSLSAETALTGAVPALLLASAALTAPLTLFLLWLYRRAVLRAMAAQAGAAAQAKSPSRLTPTADAPPLQIRMVDATAADGVETPIYRQALHSLFLASAIYVTAGLAYAFVMASPWILSKGVEGVPLTRLLWLLSCYAWPTALAVGMLAAVSRGQRMLVGLVYFAMLFAVAIFGLVRNAELTPNELVLFWLLTNAPATLLLLALLHRRVRAVGPLVLAFMVVAVTGAVGLVYLVGWDEGILRGVIAMGGFFGLGGHGVFVALHVLGFALFGLAGWWFLGRIGRRYEQRKMSDQSLTLDAMWLLFGVVQSITFAFEGWLWVFTGLLAFAAYKVVTHVGFAIAGVARGGASTPTLLLLRVFALGGRSQRLFDALSKRWLRVGSISMIAGPDLVASAVEPHEFLDYLSGRLSHRFVRGSEDLRERLHAIQRSPDPDGRYRVNEFFCHADTWKDTMTTLAASADAVLMDLRSFSPSNQGCIFELQQLLDAVPLERIVFLLDDATDQAFLEHALREAWTRVRSDSPNLRLPAPEARLLRVATQAAADVRGLLALLWSRPAAQAAAA